MTPVETVRTVTVLGLALHDLLTDARVVDGLAVTAHPAGGGRVTAAFSTLSGAYAFRGLPGMRRAEAGEPDGEREFLLTVVDRRRRYVPTVLRVVAPVHGLLTQDDLDVPSLPGAELPVYLFSAPGRALPAHVATVRAQLTDEDGTPASFARLSVTVDPGGPAETRASGIADDTGAVVVAFAYPRFAGVPGPPGSLPPAGTRGEPTAARSWDLVVRVHREVAVLDRPAGFPAPTWSSVLAQRPARVVPQAGDPPADELARTLEYGSALVLRTAGDPRSRLLVGAA